ncbi:hypothetical protein RB594_009525 [Gaeumannomyces avenae]
MNTLLSVLVAMASLAAASPILPPSTALLSPRDPAEHGCTDTSFGHPDAFAWSVAGFDYHASYTFTTPAHQNSWGYVNFNLTNPALAPAVAVCSASSNQLSDFFYGTMEYTCALPGGGPIVGGGRGGEATFDFSRPSGVLNIKQTWSCHDQDPQYPITFWAYGNATLSLECEDTTWTNPNWTQGQIYSSRTVQCAPVSLPIKPHTMTAVA